MTAIGVLSLSIAISFTGFGPAAASTLQKGVQQVLVTNKTLAVPVAAPSQPVQFGGNVDLSGSGVEHTTTAYTVPAGKRLVIEFVSVTLGHADVGELVAFSTGSGPKFVVPLTAMPGCLANCAFFSGSEQTRVYASAGENVTMHAFGFPRVVQFAFSGYLVNAS